MRARTIRSIYQEFCIPHNLAMHMVRTAAIGELIYTHWRGPAIDYDVIVTALLLHDMGNIVKMDLRDPLLQEAGEELEAVVEMRDGMIALYGPDDHAVSVGIARSLRVPEREVSLIGDKLFIKNDIIVNSSDYELKITAYADQRVGPLGILPLAERFSEAKERYRGKAGSSMNHPDVDALISAAHKIESQVLSHTDLKPEDINDTAIDPLVDRLFSYDISLS
jgi:hypothetical protein